MVLRLLSVDDEDIEQPSLADFQRIIKKFETGEITGFFMSLDDQDRQNMIIDCDGDQCVVDTTVDKSFIAVDFSKSRKEEVDVKIGGQINPHKAYQLCPRATAVKAATTFAMSGTLNRDVDWEEY